MKNTTWPKRYFWQYGRSSHHIFDYFLWFLLRPLMIALGSGKITHWWHWKREKIPQGAKGFRLKGNDTSFTLRYKIFLGSYVGFDPIRKSLGGWQDCYVLRSAQIPWYFAFGDMKDARYLQRCVIKLEGPISMLVGPNDFTAYAFDEHGQEVELFLDKTISRKENSWPLI